MTKFDPTTHYRRLNTLGYSELYKLAKDVCNFESYQIDADTRLIDDLESYNHAEFPAGETLSGQPCSFSLSDKGYDIIAF